MASNKLRVQRFRTNDLNNNGGKQFELGKGWCEEFFGIDPSLSEAIISLIFKPLCFEHASLLNKEIELKLAEITNRGDRKAYANGQHGLSQIKNLFIDDLHLTEEDNLSDYFAIYKASINQYYLYYIPQMLYDNFIKLFESITPDISVEKDTKRTFKDLDDRLSFQQIFYGAPGTGKSHRIKENENVKKADEKNLVFRTTFHPDSDYSTFVGAYKPTMRPVADKYKAVAGKDEEITYSFVPQAFLQAYVAAWNNQDDSVYLIIEEINRGNCAQIFGDLFQLLDRDCEGYSEYPIVADKDLCKYLKGKDENNQDVLSNKDGIKDGKLRMPKNLFIWATMNTSDQSLFPIDSAFKRRWDWKYIPISDGMKGWKIEANSKHYDWWQFLQKMNDQIGSTTNSEDKKLGYYFCKAKNGIIDAETFVGKVMFYVWNDVYKDFAEEAGDLFKDEDDSILSFSKFYAVGADGKTRVVENKVTLFLQNLGVSIEEEASDADDAEELSNESMGEGKHKYLQSVLFPDGTLISSAQMTRFEVYLESLKKIGFDKVFPLIANMKYKRKGCPLMSLEEHQEILNSREYTYHQEGNFYIVKGANDDTLINVLAELNTQLDLGVEITYK